MNDNGSIIPSSLPFQTFVSLIETCGTRSVSLCCEGFLPPSTHTWHFCLFEGMYHFMREDNPIHNLPIFQNTDCFGETKSGRIGFRWLAITLVMIFRTMLHREMGLNFLGDSAPCSFRSRVNKVALKAFNTLFVLLDSSTTS